MSSKLLQNTNFSSWISLILTTLLTFGLLSWLLTLTLNTTLITFWITLKNNLLLSYVHSYNRCLAGKVGHLNVILFFLFSGTLGLVLQGLLTFFQRPQSISKLLTRHLIIMLVCIISFQQWLTLDKWRLEKKEFAGKTLEDRNRLVGGQMYEFARISQQLLTQRHKATFTTDANLSTDPPMTHHRLLSYYLYPKAVFRFAYDHPHDIELLYYKKNAVNYLGDEYQILIADQNKNLVLAIKKGQPQ